MSKNWSMLRWIRESCKYMRGTMPVWKIVWKAILKWPAFNRQQKLDEAQLARSFRGTPR